MKSGKPAFVVAVITGLCFATPAWAAIQFDQNVTTNAIFGGGNANGSYTTDRAAGVEIGLRGKLRHNSVGLPENTFNSNGDGTYSFYAGVAPGQSYPTGVWSFEWSINTNFDGSSSWDLDDLTYVLSLDQDPTVGVTNFFSFDPINAFNPGETDGHWDHSIGTNATASGAGTEAGDITTYNSLIASNNLAQNSWKAHWYIPGFNPNAVGEYTIQLTAYDGANQVAQSLINIEVTVPEPGSLLVWSMLGLALGGTTWWRRRNRAT